MAKDNRLYARLALDFAENPKVEALSPEAFRALIEMILYSRRLLTDGFIRDDVAAKRWASEVLSELSSNDVATPSLIVTDGGYLIHDFLKHQDSRAEVEERRERNRIAGSAGGKAKAQKERASKSLSKPLSDMSSENVAETETETRIKDTVQPPVEPKSPYSDLFESWWKHYPRRESKRDAFKAWEQLRKARELPDVDRLIAAAESYAKREQRPEFRKLPAGWLRDGKWEDEAQTNVTSIYDRFERPKAPEGQVWAADYIEGEL